MWTPQNRHISTALDMLPLSEEQAPAGAHLDPQPTAGENERLPSNFFPQEASSYQQYAIDVEAPSTFHQEGCPYANSPPTIAEHGLQVCRDRRCCVWHDLITWFGYEGAQLPAQDFAEAFTDAAHGGAGLYEKLIVLGGKTLEVVGEMLILEQFDATGIPADLLHGVRVPQAVTAAVWARKRTERLGAPPNLAKFAKAYLVMAQTLPSDVARLKYAKACAGYATWAPQGRFKNIFHWMPELAEHIYWIARLELDAFYPNQDNELLQDLQEYFGYGDQVVSQNIQQVLRTVSDARTYGKEPLYLTGEALLRTTAADYFRELAKEVGISGETEAAWVVDETDALMRSAAIPLFAGTWLNLSGYAEETASAPEALFKQLVGACHAGSRDGPAAAWLVALLHRLRQIQLLIRVRAEDLTATGAALTDLDRMHGTGAFRWSALSDCMQRRFLRFNADEPAAGGGGAPQLRAPLTERPARPPPESPTPAAAAPAPPPSPLNALILELARLLRRAFRNDRRVERAVKRGPERAEPGELPQRSISDELLPGRRNVARLDTFWNELVSSSASGGASTAPRLAHSPTSLVGPGYECFPVPYRLRGRQRNRDGPEPAHRPNANGVGRRNGWRPPGAVLMRRRARPVEQRRGNGGCHPLDPSSRPAELTNFQRPGITIVTVPLPEAAESTESSDNDDDSSESVASEGSTSSENTDSSGDDATSSDAVLSGELERRSDTSPRTISDGSASTSDVSVDFDGDSSTSSHAASSEESDECALPTFRAMTGSRTGKPVRIAIAGAPRVRLKSRNGIMMTAQGALAPGETSSSNGSGNSENSSSGGPSAPPRGGPLHLSTAHAVAPGIVFSNAAPGSSALSTLTAATTTTATSMSDSELLVTSPLVIAKRANPAAGPLWGTCSSDVGRWVEPETATEAAKRKAAASLHRYQPQPDDRSVPRTLKPVAPRAVCFTKCGRQ